MQWELAFPVAQILTCTGASVVYLYKGDWGRGLYWFFAGALTASVTFLPMK